MVSYVSCYYQLSQCSAERNLDVDESLSTLFHLRNLGVIVLGMQVEGQF